jgi:hypothetical protein
VAAPQIVPPPSAPLEIAPRRMTRRERLRNELLNAPNLMTLGRIALIPVFLWLLAYESRHNSFIACRRGWSSSSSRENS